MKDILVENKYKEKIDPYHFDLPRALQQALPTEERGIRRDQVRLMVSHIFTDEIQHTSFDQLDQYLNEGDVLVVNTSGTLKASVTAFRSDGEMVRVHFSTLHEQDEAGQYWIVEIRTVKDHATHRFDQAVKGEVLGLKNGGSIELVAPYYSSTDRGHLQLWIAGINLPISLEEYLDYYGEPIRYHRTASQFPQSYYQTVFANELGSAEMPSAGRPFTAELVTRLVAKGVEIVPVLLHTGVSSLEINEQPYEEYYRVSVTAAARLNAARRDGRRIIAVGTTVVRAIESVVGTRGLIRAGEGWTDLVITPQRGLYVVDGLLTGFHEPRASHLYLLEALAERAHLKKAYREALREQYQWHEFGDLHLLLP